MINYFVALNLDMLETVQLCFELITNISVQKSQGWTFKNNYRAESTKRAHIQERLVPTCGSHKLLNTQADTFQCADLQAEGHGFSQWDKC